ncbi:aminopeptidase I zinc metalloprotease-domain-containing protein [Zychaea mexicana]|uniref:aminopeptidase I zinc metalloprotease-domain-containing protein n=1 Tax=Zychaea mexicana TaxID=64656 RepID=UPI0022FE1CEC|nr:aminopeptidase I zinc metalloprotease-domain-containing protein [Zychaea mexicana]KAI9490473.1 aminopeptidase I zinc metalloprotease-domain-containing protein [Zychaea mexicana]
MSKFLNEPTQLARKAAVVLYQNRMEQELEIAIDTINKFLRTGSGGQNRDPRIVRRRMNFLRFWGTLIRDYRLTITTRIHSMYEYKELIWKWEDIYDDCVSLANTHIEAEEGHHPLLIRVLADEMGVKPSQIRDFELVLYDTQVSTIGGNIENDTNVRVTVCFDNDKIGSTTAHGADSNPLPTTLQRLANTELLSGAKVSPTAFEEAMHKSILISADMVHAIHPNYPEKHEENHRPHMHKGTVIKINANQRYATTAVTSLVSKELAKKHVIPIQEFVVRNDSPCGSTIGPMLSAKLGLRTVDVGNPQLSMHSIREVGGTDDVKHGIDLLQVFFEEFAELEARIVVD